MNASRGGLLNSDWILNRAAFPLPHKSYLHARHGSSERQHDYGYERGDISGYFTFFQILALNSCSWEYLGMPLDCNFKEYNYYPVDASSSKWEFYFILFFCSVTKPLPAPASRNEVFPYHPYSNPGFFSTWYTISTGPGVLPSLPSCSFCYLP